MKYSPYSYSKLSLHRQCNRKFKYKYLDKIPEPIVDKTPLIKGSKVHSMLEQYPNHEENEYTYILNKFLKGKYSYLLKRERISEQGIGLSENLTPEKYKKDTMFRGYIDYFTVIDNIMYIIDWKTGKYRDLQYQDFNQLLFYSIFMFNKYSKINKIKIMYIYVEHDLDNSIMLERKYLNKYIAELQNSINNVETDKGFKKTEQVLCKWCGYKEICEQDS